MRNLTETLDLINSGKLSPEEHLSEVLENIKEDENINSFISLGLEAAKEMAKKFQGGPTKRGCCWHQGQCKCEGHEDKLCFKDFKRF